MNKKNKISVILIFVTFFLLIGITKCQAAGNLHLRNLDFDVNIKEDGSMDVTETWNISIENTNTLFKTFKTDRKKYSSISNVHVSEIYQGIESKFNQVDSLMYHVTRNCYYGLINNEGNFEIAWGVGLDDSSAMKTYKISYTVKDAIAKYSDYAELYWQFVGSDFEISSSKVTGTITLPKNVSSKEDIRVWGHTEDLNGEIYVTGLNQIKFELTSFNPGRYIEIRTLFPTEIISSSNRTYSKNVLQEVISEETEWANEANLRRENRQKTKNKISIFFVVIALIISFFIFRKALKNFKKAAKMKKIIPTINLEYYREMPRKDATPSQALFLYKNATKMFTPTEMGRIFSASLLNLSLKKCIEFEKEPEEKNNIKIKILKREVDNINIAKSEKEVLEFILGAAGSKDYITIKEIQKYMKSYSRRVIRTKEDIEKSTKKELKEKNIYNEEEAMEKESFFSNFYAIIVFVLFMSIALFPILLASMNIKIAMIGVIALIISIILNVISSIKYERKLNPLTQEGTNEKIMWKGLKKYMEDFSMLDKREVPELVIWEEFLVYATAFGIADKVLKQLKIVYKDLDNMDFGANSYMYLMINTDFSSSFSNAISSAVTSSYAQNYSSSYSSGSGFGGGFSGGGGGGRWPEVVEEVDNTSFPVIKNLTRKEK